MEKLLLIDANSIIHRCYHALPPLSTPLGEPSGALYGVSSILLKIAQNNPPRYVAACFDRPEPTFRKEKYKEYKAQRPPAPSDLISQIIAAKEVFREFGITVFEAPGFEADDIIATLASRFGEEEGIAVEVLTGDRDTLQLISGDKITVRFFRKGISDTVLYNEDQVQKDFNLRPKQLIDYKILIGDPSDNIKGVEGIGPKTAQAILARYGNLPSAIGDRSAENKFRDKLPKSLEEIDLLRELIVLRKDAPINQVGIKDLMFEFQKERLSRMFDAMGFESLKKRLIGESEAYDAPKTKPKQPPSPQGKMF